MNVELELQEREKGLKQHGWALMSWSLLEKKKFVKKKLPPWEWLKDFEGHIHLISNFESSV